MEKVGDEGQGLILASETGRFVETSEAVDLMVEDLVAKGGDREAITGFLDRRTRFNSDVSKFSQSVGGETVKRFLGDKLSSAAENEEEIKVEIGKYLEDYLQVGIQISGRGLVLRPGRSGEYQQKSYDITAAAFDPSQMINGSMGPLERYLTSFIPLEGEFIQECLAAFRGNRQSREQLLGQAIRSGVAKVGHCGVMSFTTAEVEY